MPESPSLMADLRRSLEATQAALTGTQQVRDSYKDRLELMVQSYEAKIQDLQRETLRCSALQRDLDNERRANAELWERLEECRRSAKSETARV